MKKTNVLTLHGDIYEQNIGNVLQSYALCRTLKKMKCKNRLIFFVTLSPKHILIKTLRKIKWTILKIKKQKPRYSAAEILKIKWSDLKMNKKKHKRNRLFKKFYIEIERKKKRIGFKYNRDTYYICGSDQIWNPSYAGGPEFFAYGADNEKRISYAASMGVSVLDEEIKKKYTEYLREMKYVSVRENTVADIVKELAGYEVPVLCDPTMLLSKEEWEAVSEPPEFTAHKYILTYFLGQKETEYSDYISKLAEKLHCKVINLERLNHNDYWYSVGPAEFLWLINNCELMCTDSFHGSVFSVIMQKPFLVFDRCDEEMPMNSRLDNLLSKLNLCDRRFLGQSIEAVLNIDYRQSADIIEKEKEKALNFLKNAIGVD